MERSFECCGIELPLHKCIIICLYRIPNPNADIFLRNLECLITRLRRRLKMRIIITGDFNIDLLKESKALIEFQRIMQNYNYKVHVDQPTRAHACLDLIISNIPEATSDVLQFGLSDHDTAQILNVPTSQNTKPLCDWYIFKRDYSTSNITKFTECVYSLSWTDVYTENNFNAAFNSFYDTFILFFNLCFPVCRRRMTNKPKKSSTWITKGIKKSSTIKRLLRFKYYKTKKQL